MFSFFLDSPHLVGSIRQSCQQHREYLMHMGEDLPGLGRVQVSDPVQHGYSCLPLLVFYIPQEVVNGQIDGRVIQTDLFRDQGQQMFIYTLCWKAEIIIVPKRPILGAPDFGHARPGNGTCLCPYLGYFPKFKNLLVECFKGNLANHISAQTALKKTLGRWKRCFQHV